MPFLPPDLPKISDLQQVLAFPKTHGKSGFYCTTMSSGETVQNALQHWQWAASVDPTMVSTKIIIYYDRNIVPLGQYISMLSTAIYQSTY